MCYWHYLLSTNDKNYVDEEWSNMEESGMSNKRIESNEDNMNLNNNV